MVVAFVTQISKKEILWIFIIRNEIICNVGRKTHTCSRVYLFPFKQK